MEVRHHSALHHKKKYFNKYFLEFPLISFEVGQRFIDKTKQLIKVIKENISFWLKPIISFFHYHRLNPVVMNSTSTGFSQKGKKERIKNL